MMRGFCPKGFCPERAYVLMELCMEGVLSEGVLSGGRFVLPSIQTQQMFCRGGDLLLVSVAFGR